MKLSSERGDPVEQIVLSLLSLNFGVLAAGDSYNDIDMLQTADKGIFFQAPNHIKEEFPDLLIADNHEELKVHLLKYI